MPTKYFGVGSLVWAKMKGFPAWPGKIIDPPVDAKSPNQKKHQHYVYFFGSNNHAWILDENIVPHDDSMVQSANTKKSSAYESAIEAIVSQSKNAKKQKTVAPKILKERGQIADKQSSQFKTPKQYKVHKQNNALSQESSPGKATSLDKVPSLVNNVPKKGLRELRVIIEKSDVPVQRKTAKKQPFIDTETAKKLSVIDNETAKKQPLIDTETAKSSLVDTNDVVCPVSSIKTEPVENDYTDLLASVPPNMSFSHIDDVLKNDSGYQDALGILSRPEYIEQPPNPVLDVSDISVSVKKEIAPCSKNIGFLGLGNMGQGIVKNLLNSGHHVTVWNRTPEKMDAVLNAGASRGETPADVVQASDITFSCVSDSDAVKCLIFGNCGVLSGLDLCPGSNKGYVEMTSIDPETSKAVADEITLKGGRYLEAPIEGSIQNAIEGTILIHAAGDETLFTDCETCFYAIGNSSYYISSDVGTGARCNLLRSMMYGSLYAGMIEFMALVQRCGLSQHAFFDLLKLGSLNSQAMQDMGHAILEGNFANIPLEHIQKDVDLALALNASTNQPLPVTAASNEVCKRLCNADDDASAV